MGRRCSRSRTDRQTLKPVSLIRELANKHREETQSNIGYSHLSIRLYGWLADCLSDCLFLPFILDHLFTHILGLLTKEIQQQKPKLMSVLPFVLGCLFVGWLVGVCSCLTVCFCFVFVD